MRERFFFLSVNSFRTEVKNTRYHTWLKNSFYTFKINFYLNKHQSDKKVLHFHTFSLTCGSPNTPPLRCTCRGQKFLQNLNESQLIQSHYHSLQRKIVNKRKKQ